MLHLRLSTPYALTDAAVRVLDDDPTVHNLAVLRAASLRPPGDVILADLPRESANEIIDQLRDLGVQREGCLALEPVNAWLSQSALDAERRAPGASADAVVWADVVQQAYDGSELNWMYLSFMSMAMTLAAIAIVIDSQILTIGAMVLGPEFAAVAALGLALVRRRLRLFRVAARTLVLGFAVAIAITALLALLGRAAGLITAANVSGQRPGTDFIYSPDRWSFIVAVIAGAAGVLSLTSSKVTGLSGVFISVTTVPAAGNIGLALALGAGHEIAGSAEQLALNIVGMALAGWATLALQQAVWSRVLPPRLGSSRRPERP